MMDLMYWLWITLLDGISSRKTTALFEKFDSIEEIYRAEKEDYSGISGISKRDAEALSDKSLARAEKVKEECKAKGIRILTYDSQLYPANLVHIFDPPYVLYVRSKERLDLNKHLCMSVIGNRKITDYGRAVTRKIAGDLAKEGVTVVSGMARGADGEAHAAAITAGAKTIAVLGCGVDICYPHEHKNLMYNIIENGMVISEYPPGTPPIPKNFPQRNRIISGLSVATIVTEAANPSGTLITASVALEQNREVFAVPGNITSVHSEACNKLIGSDGAKAIVSAEDVLSVFRGSYAEVLERNKPQAKPEIKEETQEVIPINEKYAHLGKTDQMIMKNMSVVPIHIDELIEKTNISADELLCSLTMLEISGMIKSYPGKFFGLNV